MCAPSVFQRLVDFVLAGLSYFTCLVYLDDIIIFGRTFEEQLSLSVGGKTCSPFHFSTIYGRIYHRLAAKNYFRRVGFSKMAAAAILHFKIPKY